MPQHRVGAETRSERPSSDLDALATEAGGDAGTDLEALSTRALVDLMRSTRGESAAA